jgi:AcrR family transcriptional regulator
MSRPTEPQKKEEILERCLTAMIAEGVLDSSLNAIAKKIGVSGRMLVYHFGSKQELERQLISLLEIRLRNQLRSLQTLSLEESDRSAKPLLEMWKHLTSLEMRGLLKLTMELNQKAIQGDTDIQQFLEHETQQWIESLSLLTRDKTVALSLFHLFQGALLDFLTTGNAHRGEQTIRAFIQSL